MPRNPYSQPPSRYGRTQGPTGLGGFLSRQPAISQRQIDPATGFPARPQPYGAVMGRPDFGSIGRNASKGKSGSKGGASTVNPSRPENVQGISDVFMEGVENAQLLGNNAPQAREGQIARFPGLTAPPSPTFGNNPPQSPAVPEIGMIPRGGREFDRARKSETGSPPPMIDAGQYLRTGRLQTQGPERSMGRFQSQGPESLMRMGKAPNIRPAMNVGKATGGPVGLASLIGRY